MTMEREKYFDYTENVFDIKKVFGKPEALKDIRIIEFGTLVLGPATATYLGEFGAEVIKVELPGAGDTMRSLTPWGQFWKNAALGWLSEARNKYHIAIDVHKEKGQEIFKELVAKSDILVENMRAGTLERKFGIGYRQLKEINPRLIYVANSGFGQWGPFSVGRASYDAVAQAVSGLASITGFPGHPPLKAGIWVGDYYGALMAAVGVLAALHYRDRTGKGQYIDFSQSENLIRALDWTWIYCGLTGKNRERSGNRDLAIAPSNVYRAKDGFVAVSAVTDEEFKALSAAMGKEELAADERFGTMDERVKRENSDALDAMIKEWVSDKTVGEVEELGEKYGFGAARILNAKDHYESEHLRTRGSVWSVDDPIYGEVVEYGPVPKMSETPGRIKWAGKPVGYDNEKILGELLGYSPEELKQLEEEEVIGKWADAPGRKPPEDFKG